MNFKLNFKTEGRPNRMGRFQFLHRRCSYSMMSNCKSDTTTPLRKFLLFLLFGFTDFPHARQFKQVWLLSFNRKVLRDMKNSLSGWNFNSVKQLTNVNGKYSPHSEKTKVPLSCCERGSFTFQKSLFCTLKEPLLKRPFQIFDNQWVTVPIF